MEIMSVNIGQLKRVKFDKTVAYTGIFKVPVQNRLMLRTYNLDGDRQGDLKAHGGRDKALYAYPSEHYRYWENILGTIPQGWGAFGENITTRGLIESETRIGSHYRVGNATVMVTQPRMPCKTLAMKFDRDDMIDLFYKSRRSGFYLSVLEEGTISAGDDIELMHEDPDNVTISDVNSLYLEENNQELLERVLAAPELSNSQRQYFEKRKRKSKKPIM